MRLIIASKTALPFLIGPNPPVQSRVRQKQNIDQNLGHTVQISD